MQPINHLLSQNTNISNLWVAAGLLGLLIKIASFKHQYGGIQEMAVAAAPPPLRNLINSLKGKE